MKRQSGGENRSLSALLQRKRLTTAIQGADRVTDRFLYMLKFVWEPTVQATSDNSCARVPTLNVGVCLYYCMISGFMQRSYDATKIPRFGLTLHAHNMLATLRIQAVYFIILICSTPLSLGKIKIITFKSTTMVGDTLGYNDHIP